MPHAPRCRDGKLYLLDSGTGRFGVLNPDDGRFDEIAFCPGYLRGLAFHRGFAIVGVSEPRDNKTFSGLPLEEALARRRADPICALLVIDLTTGAILHWLKIEGLVSELYDIVALPGVRRPQAVGLKTDEIRRILTLES